MILIMTTPTPVDTSVEKVVVWVFFSELGVHCKSKMPISLGTDVSN